MLSDALHSFRRNAVHVRQGLEGLSHQVGRLKVDGGQIRDADLIERFKRLAIPVRRALNPNDRAAFESALTVVLALPPAAGGKDPGLSKAVASWTVLQTELDSTVTLGGAKVARRKILAGFLDAAAFYDRLDRDKAYNAFIEEWGTAAEGLGAQLTEDAARVIVRLDTAAAYALEEPEILPPPEKTPPPPPDPKEPLWRRIMGLVKDE